MQTAVAERAADLFGSGGTASSVSKYKHREYNKMKSDKRFT
jgi:hypothetical protein